MTIIWPTPKPAVKVAIEVLAAAFGEYALVSAAMPRQRPIRFIYVDRAGGSQPNPVTDQARILIKLFGQDVETVEAMANTARAALRNAQGTVVNLHNAAGVLTDTAFVRYWGDEQGPVNFPDPDIIDMVCWRFHGDLLVSTTTPS